ncbi:calcium-binding protein [Microvirga yunnanensis]|uniref:calcium-binding protein n=1 Tax=Microvirga yunnanensis TaxID=2953740 RepID=UPI0021C5EA75|nr:calcium-binding protein [Microvirga sp. HBU65207]
MAIRYATEADPNVDGTSGNDYLFGSRHANELRGLEGSDWLFGYGGDDALFGGPNNDYLFGRRGADHLRGEAGNDWLIGGKGPDTFHFVRDGGKDTVTDLNPSEGDRIVFGEGVGLLLVGGDAVAEGTTYQEFDFNSDGKIDKTTVYLDYDRTPMGLVINQVSDTSGKPPDYITFLYASWEDVQVALGMFQPAGGGLFI